MSESTTSEHLDRLKVLHEKEKELSIDELARAVFSEFDREKRGYISFQDLAAILLERSNADHGSQTSDLEIELLVESRTEVQQMLKILDPKQSGRIDYADFFRAFTFFEFFRQGYKKGFQVGFKCAEDEDDLTRFDSSDIEFDEFCHILLNDITLQKRLAAFQTNWSTVYRPGYLKTPIHKKRKLSALEDFLSGSFAGIVTTIVGHPFDTVKVRLQTQSLTLPTASSTAVEPKGALARSSMWQAIKQGGLYKGVWSPMFSIPLVNAIVFATYEQCKKMLLRHKDQSSTLSEGQLAFCGGIAGLASCSVVSPVELIRTRLQIQGSTGNPQYRGSLDCAKQILRTEGIRGLGRGMFATIARDVPSYVAQFYVYEGLKRALTPEGQSVENLPTKYLLLAGGLGGTAGWLVSYPIDNIKSNLQVAPPGTYKRHSWIPDGGLIDCFRRTVQQRSAAALFTGLVPCLLRAFPVNACAYATYEFSSKFFAEKRLFD